MSDLVGNPEDRFSQNEAQLYTEPAYNAQLVKGLIFVRPIGVEKFIEIYCSTTHEEAFCA